MPQEQISFVKGLNAVSNPESLADGEVALATNIDFSAQTGAAMARRGSKPFALTAVGAGSAPQWVWRVINQAADRDSSPYYIWRGTEVNLIALNTYGTVTSSSVLTTGSGTPAATSYQGTAFISFGDSSTTYYVNTAGTLKEWITQAPAGTLGVAIQEAQPIEFLPAWGSATVYGLTTSSGTVTGAAVSATGTAINLGNGSYIVDPLLVGTGIGLIAMTTAICTGLFGTNSNMSLDSRGLALGSNALHTLSVRCDQPTNLGFTSVLQEYSVGDTSFATKWSASSVLTGYDMADGTSIWAVPRSAFTYVTGTGTASSAPDYSWSNIQAVRVTGLCFGTGVWDMYLGSVSAYDPSVYPLSQSIGASSTATVSNTYSWYETYAQGTATTIGTATYTVLSLESAPNPVTTSVLSVFAGRALLTSTNTATGTLHTFNYRVLYRQGGSLNLPYRVAVNTLTNGTYTDTKNDVDAALDGFILQMDLASRASLSGTAITCASEPYMGRLFLAGGNQILWSLPGQPQVFPNTNYAIVSSPGDQVQALQQYMPSMVIVNQDSIYEMQGQYFEGSLADYTLYRTGARRGSKAQFTAIKTPYGIPILDYDGLYFYQPGAGVEQPLPWVTERVGDMFRGTATTDPAIIQSRTPAVNLSAISSSWAAFATNKLYLALPCGTATIPSHMLVVDFTYQRVWLYNYPVSYSAGMYDSIGNRLLGLDSSGNFNRLEYGLNDINGTATQPITWTVRTKRWQWPDSSRLIHLHPQLVGNSTSTVNYETYDSTYVTQVLGTNTLDGTAWPSYSMAGVLANSAEFRFSGTVPTTATIQEGLKEVYWDIMPEGQTVTYFRSTTFHHPTIYQSEYFGASAQENEWQLCNLELRVPGTSGTCTVTGTVYVDGTSIMTATITGDAKTQIPYVWSISLPPKTFGRNGWMEATSNTGRFCAIHQWFMTVPSPETFTTRRTQPEVWEGEQEVRDVQAIIDPLGGTAKGTVFLDNVVVGTFTVTGSEQVPVVYSLPTFTYANSGYVIYNAYGTGTGTQYIKEWKTWFEKAKEPARVTTWRTETKEYPNGQIFQTWLAVLNPLGGIVTGTLVMDGTAINTATFTGTRQLNYETGVDFTNVRFAPNVKANTCWVIYNSSTPFKHYVTEYIVESAPNQKLSWMINYGKLGGVSQIDMARWWDLDIEISGTATATITSYWDTDFGTALCTNTLLVAPGRQWVDRISFPPGIRGRLFQQRMMCSVPCQVWSSNLELIPMMIKGATRRTISKIPGVAK